MTTPLLAPVVPELKRMNAGLSAANASSSKPGSAATGTSRTVPAASTMAPTPVSWMTRSRSGPASSLASGTRHLPA